MWFFPRNMSIVLMLLLAGVLPGCKSSPDSRLYLGIPAADIENELDDLLAAWYPRLIDTIHGGYWTNFEYNWTLSKEQDKMLVTQARGLWAAARAASVFPENPIFKKAATHGFRFLTSNMWDEQNGGFCQYYYSDSSFRIDPSYKLMYGNAFALYALAEYANIQPDKAALDWVKKTFAWMEQNAHDSIGTGYYNMVLPGHPMPPVDASSAEIIHRIGWSDADQKDQNTSIHLLEALTSTYKVFPDPLVRKRLLEMLSLVRDSMVNADGYLNLFFSDQWKPVSHRDSSRMYVISHLGTDHISFGHNIETAYLLVDASTALYGKPDPKTLGVGKKLVDHTLTYGFDRNYYGVFDKGYTFHAGSVEIMDSTKTWWAQVEAWHALALFSSLYPQEPRYAKAFARMWNYMQKELIDQQYGGLYNNGLDINPENKTDRKGHAWKSCYHDGRALFQVVSYARQSM
jgi:mannobiose 2-epimerase